MMPFDFSPRQQELFDRIAQLNETRSQFMALNYGSTTVHQPEPHLLIIVRKYMEQEVRSSLTTVMKTATLKSGTSQFLQTASRRVSPLDKMYHARNSGQFNQE